MSSHSSPLRIYKTKWVSRKRVKRATESEEVSGKPDSLVSEILRNHTASSAAIGRKLARDVVIEDFKTSSVIGSDFALRMASMKTRRRSRKEPPHRRINPNA